MVIKYFIRKVDVIVVLGVFFIRVLRKLVYFFINKGRVLECELKGSKINNLIIMVDHVQNGSVQTNLIQT